MMSHIRPAVTMILAMTVLTGLAYPFAMTGVAGVIAPDLSTGSIVERDGRPVGSDLIGQAFASPTYLHPRPSSSDWNAAGTSASNLGPTAQALIDAVDARRAAYVSDTGALAPVDAVSVSGSSLDPHVSPQNARAQAARIATARGVPQAAVLALIAAHTEGRWLGIYGEPRVNVLRVNLDLDQALPAAAAPAG